MSYPPPCGAIFIQDFAKGEIYYKVKEESLPTEDYLTYLYPFDNPDFKKTGWNRGGL